MAGNCNRDAYKAVIDVHDFADSLNSARDLYRKGTYNKAFDIYERLVDAFPEKSIDLLAEIYDCYKLLSDHDRYYLYQARRFDFQIMSNDKVLDIGSGHAPFHLATHIAELEVDDNNYGRAGLPFKHVDGKELYVCSVEDMPFEDHQFDFVYCSHVLEHVNGPEKACEELMRIAKRGYIETPTEAKDLWLGSAVVSNHRWSVEYNNNKLMFAEYTREEMQGLHCDILQSMHCNPQTTREKAFSALIYLKPEKFNTMFLWEDSFEYGVRRILTGKGCSDQSQTGHEIGNETFCSESEKKENGTAAALNAEGEELYGKGSIRDAFYKFKEAIAMDPELAVAHNNIGVIFWQTGSTKEALRHFTSSIRTAPYDKETNLNLGQILIALERYEEAANVCSAYLKVHPDDNDMSSLMDSIKSEPENEYQYANKHDGRLRFLQINTFYIKYLDEFYRKNPDLSSCTFKDQVARILSDGFSAVHDFTDCLRNSGYETQFIIANCIPAQEKWLSEHGQVLEAGSAWITEIVLKQIDDFRPDVLFLSDSYLFDTKVLGRLSHKPGLVLGWTGEPVPEGLDWSGFDSILSNFSYSSLRALEFGAKSTEHFYPGFPKWLNDNATENSTEFDVVFVGQWSELHNKRKRYISALAREAVIKKGFKLGLYLSGDSGSMPPEVKECCCGERYGLAMHDALRSGRIAINAGILPAAGNMRLFEVTGTGVFLLSEYQPNINEYFEDGREVETFRNEDELIEKIHYYLQHPDQRETIAKRGQERCFRDHSMEKRSVELDRIIKKHLSRKSSRKDNENSNQYGTESSIVTAGDKLENIREMAQQRRFSEYEVKFRGMTIHCHDLLSFYMAAKDIFLQGIYDFETANQQPVVIDGGGHIGLFTLYAKQKYPDSLITVFEPDKESLELLNKNIEANGIKNVEIVNAGLYANEGEVSFGSDHSDGSSIYAKEKETNIKVVPLSKYIDSEIDFLKLNIEGAELDVLHEIESKLPLIKELVIEYHGFPEIGQKLHEILAILDRNGFRYTIHDFDAETNSATKPPFRLTKDTRFFLLIYAKRLAAPKKISHEINTAADVTSVEPVSRVFGFDRGTPIDRYYIEGFLERNRHFIRGRVLEISDNTYTIKYGTGVTHSDVLNAVPSQNATIVGDLATGENIPEDLFDCIIMTQTIQFIYDIKSALRNAVRALKPGGTLLITAAGISQISRYDMDRWGEYWRFTDRSLGKVLSEIVPEEAMQVESFGNVAVAKAFLDGLSLEELTNNVLDYKDEDYQVLLTSEVKKPEIKKAGKSAPSNEFSGNELLKSPTVLLYHRVADDPIDSQLLALSPENFEAHLKVITTNCSVLPLWELLKETSNGMFRPDTVALTFDDGYLDVLNNAVPLLEKYGVHATVFITSGMIGSEYEFWWDILERIFLTGNALPDVLEITVSDEIKKWELAEARQRLKAYDDIANILRTNSPEEISIFINNLLDWAGLGHPGRNTHRVVNHEQLLQLSSSPSIEIGSHTINHAWLSTLSPDAQKEEIIKSGEQIEQIIKKRVRLFSYPFGSVISFTEESRHIVREAGYDAGISNIQGSITASTDIYSVPRVLVRDWTGRVFSDWLRSDDKSILERESMSKRDEKLINYQMKLTSTPETKLPVE